MYNILLRMAVVPEDWWLPIHLEAILGTTDPGAWCSRLNGGIYNKEIEIKSLRMGDTSL